MIVEETTYDGQMYGCYVECFVLKRAIDNDSRRLDNCPLIAVSDHGRLIDADAMRSEIPPCYTMEEIVKAFKDAPTIIPADKE